MAIRTPVFTVPPSLRHDESDAAADDPGQHRRGGHELAGQGDIGVGDLPQGIPEGIPDHDLPNAVFRFGLWLVICATSFENAHAPEATCFSGAEMAYFQRSSLIQTVTVGPGISPDRPACAGSRALPPVGNFTLPRRSFMKRCSCAAVTRRN